MENDFPQKFSELNAKVDSFLSLFKNHKHLGTDMTQKIGASSGSYGGRVLSGATGTLPTGWTVSKNATPVYTVTHNLGKSSYSVVAFAYGANLPLVSLAYNTNTFTAEFDNSTGTAFATDWNFILTLIT